MKYQAAILFLFLVPGRALAQPDVGQLEARLAEATGKARLDLLLELAEALQRKSPAKAVGFGTEALEQLDAISDEDRKLGLLIALSRAHLNLRDTQNGLRYGGQAEELARAAGNKQAEAHAIYLIGRNHWRADAPQLALAALTRSIDLYEEIDDRVGQGKASIYAGYVYQNLRDAEKALTVFLDAHRLFEEAGDLRWIGIALNNIGIVYHRLGQVREALEFYEQALEIQQTRNDRDQIGRLLQNIGVVHLGLGDPAKALDAHLRALAVLESVGNREPIANTTINIGTDYRALGDFEKSLAYYQRALPISEELGDKRLVGRIWVRIGNVHRLSGKYEAAREALEQALALTTGALVQDQRAEAFKELAETYEALGRYREALEAVRQHQAILIEKYDEDSRRSIAEMQARFETQQKQKEIELLKQRQALSDLDLERQRDWRRALVGGFGLVLFVLLLLFNRFRLKAREALMVETVKQERAVSAGLREVDRLRDEFLANTSHELRTPLFGMTGLAESLIDGAAGELPEAAKANLSMIVSSGRRLTALVGEILDYSKLKHAGLTLERRPVDLRALTEVVLTLSRPLVGSKNLVLRNAVAADLPPAEADENRLQQVLHNLVGNAVKFTESGTVQVSAAAEGDRLVVCVRDTGPGIPKEDQERIFEAFEQAGATGDRQPGGTGLGLAVTRQLVELHGGRIWAESSPGKGSRLFFSLPISSREPDELARLPPAARTPAIEAALAPFSPDDTGSAPAGATARVLIVDDEPVNRQVLRNYLSTQKLDVTASADGEEALRLLLARPFDLVLLDVMMPKMSGFEVCRVLRETRRLEELPVIFLTAKTQVSDVVTGLALGANDYLTKPISKDELIARIRPHLDLVHLYGDLQRRVEERMSQIKVLRGMLPICASCKKIRDDKGYWSQLEVFIDSHSEAYFSHGICPDCVITHYGGSPDVPEPSD